MSIKILQIGQNSEYLEKVISLGDANKSTLGFFPRDAYKQSAQKKQIIIAVEDNTKELIGYLLYSASREKMLISIVHLCINSSWRGKGVTKLLFDTLKTLTKDSYLGVRVRCRVDYSANKIWPKLGFVAMSEMDGRGKKGTRLTIWKFEYDQPSLFSYAFRQNDNKKVKIVIDANVLYQLQEPEISENEESLPLLEPWLDVDIYITPEMYNEIDRNKDRNRKESARKYADTFPKVDSKSSQDKFQEVQRELRPLFPESMSDSDESDLRQLTYAICADIPFFITRDELMLDISDNVFDKFGIQTLRPSDLILKQDELMRSNNYVPARLAGSQIKIEKIHAGQSQQYVDKFLAPQGETKSKFNKNLQILLSNPTVHTIFAVKDINGEDIGIVSYSRHAENEIVVNIFRLVQSPISPYIIKYLVNDIILLASKEDRKIIKIIDGYLSSKVIETLQESGFLQIQNSWVKITWQETVSVSQLITSFSENNWPDYLSETIKELNNNLQSPHNQASLLEMEKGFWPLKIQELNIPAFIVPIRSAWAMHLFDVDIAKQDLFGGEPSLILNAENVYYRSSTPKVLSAPGRILWYVSAGKGKYQGSMSIKACSYLDDVEIGKPKQLYSKYKKLGIYQWKDVYNDVAGGDLDKDIMAFKFSKTEIFKSPIHLTQLQKIWKSHGETFNNAISPLLIDNMRFFELYNLGLKG